ncbi:MAG: hypothetical protein WBW82_20310 [Candidatus Sulfotelmatobacter sp.]
MRQAMLGASEPEPEPEPESPPSFKEVVFVSSKEKSYSQIDFDARDLRNLAKARDELQLKLRNGWGSNLTTEQIFREQCLLAGISVERGLEVEARAMKWPCQSIGASA